jgi:hypothetical protein
VLTFTIAALGAAGFIAWSVLGDHGAWWIVGAGVLAAIQLTAAARVSLGAAGDAQRSEPRVCSERKTFSGSYRPFTCMRRPRFGP